MDAHSEGLSQYLLRNLRRIMGVYPSVKRCSGIISGHSLLDIKVENTLEFINNNK